MTYQKFEQEKSKTLNKVPIHELINFNQSNENVKVSIIIPVYNVEEYLEECLDSAISQTLQDIEIICVNDGSTDNSLNILKDYASRDKRIRIINKANAGYGHVMNLGMDMASGEYIGIIESDDYVLPEMFERLYSVAKEHDLDFVKSNFYRFHRGNDYLEKTFNKIAFKDENYNKIICPRENHDCFTFIMNTWCGIYKRDFLQKNCIRHFETPGASFQDNGFWFKANVYADKTMYLNDAFYMNRRDNPDSSVNDSGKMMCANREYHLIYDFLEKNDIKEDFLDVYSLKQYHNYLFTLSRIAKENKKEYLNIISKEFNQSNQKGELDTSLFSLRQINEIYWIMRDPEEFYYREILSQIKVSVILPVYNSQKHLRECLDSLLNQSLREIEIICINDGSKDNSLEILKEYKAKDNRIKIHSQENKGAGAARNKGISLAMGEYLSFLDADDFFEKDMLKLAYEKITKENADICMFESYTYDNITKTREINTNAIKKKFLPKKDVFNRNDISSNIFKDIRGWAWDKLYKRSFVLNYNLKFQEIRTTNDMYFVFVSLLKANRITILEKALYNQRVNVSTSLSNTRELSWDCFYHALMKVKEELINMNIYDKYERQFVNYALLSCIWNFETLREPLAYSLFEKLRSEWFESLGILNREKEYFENKNDYNILMEIMNIPLDDENAYKDYQINYWKNKNNNYEDIKNVPIKINEHETLSVNEIVEKLCWYRKEYN